MTYCSRPLHAQASNNCAVIAPLHVSVLLAAATLHPSQLVNCNCNKDSAAAAVRLACRASSSGGLPPKPLHYACSISRSHLECILHQVECRRVRLWAAAVHCDVQLDGLKQVALVPAEQSSNSRSSCSGDRCALQCDCVATTALSGRCCAASAAHCSWYSM